MRRVSVKADLSLREFMGICLFCGCSERQIFTKTKSVQECEFSIFSQCLKFNTHQFAHKGRAVNLFHMKQIQIFADESKAKGNQNSSLAGILLSYYLNLAATQINKRVMLIATTILIFNVNF